MSETFDTATTNPGFGGVNLCGACFTQGSKAEFLPACYLVFGPHGGPYVNVDVGSGLPVQLVGGAGTLPVSQADPPWSVTGSVTVSGTVTANQGGAWAVTANAGSGTFGVAGTVAVTNFPATQAVTGTFWQGVQPVSAASLPLPAGAATAALQTAPGSPGLPSSQVLSAQGVAGGTPLPVSGSVNAAQQGSWSVTALPGGPFVMAGQYNAVLPSVPAGGTWPLQTDSSGHLLVSWSGQSVGLSGVDYGPGPADSACLRSSQASCANGTQTSVAASTSSATILAGNSARTMASIYNDSTATLYVRMSASAASSANFTVKIPPGGYFEFPFPVYSGAVTGFWSFANGYARVTEYG
jgi:hypothetical protein